jgi:hypothetical protein
MVEVPHTIELRWDLRACSPRATWPSPSLGGCTPELRSPHHHNAQNGPSQCPWSPLSVQMSIFMSSCIFSRSNVDMKGTMNSFEPFSHLVSSQPLRPLLKLRSSPYTGPSGMGASGRNGGTFVYWVGKLFTYDGSDGHPMRTNTCLKSSTKDSYIDCEWCKHMQI